MTKAAKPLEVAASSPASEVRRIDMDRMRPSDAFAGEFCEAKGGGGGPLRAGVAGADLWKSNIAACSASSPRDGWLIPRGRGPRRRGHG